MREKKKKKKKSPRRHLEAAVRYEEAALSHKRSAELWATQGDDERAASADAF
jgi:hypothetical protein